MISTWVTRASAAVLFLGGAALLFAPDLVLPRLVAGFPASGLWLGQLLGVAWLAVALLNWMNQGTLLGGIYGRPLLLANLAIYGMSSLTLVKAVQRVAEAPMLWGLAAPALALAGIYGWLLFRGPTARDVAATQAR